MTSPLEKLGMRRPRRAETHPLWWVAGAMATIGTGLYVGWRLGGKPAAWSALDEEALARMFASEVSEDKDPHPDEARLVMGWITIQRARSAHKNLYDFITSGKGYGPQFEDRYASTIKRPTARSIRMAQALLRGEVQPSAQIRSHVPGSWIERYQGVSDEKIIAKWQAKWKEGIYGMLDGTEWVLYSADTAPISVSPAKSAKERLDSLPKIAAM